MTSPDGQPPLPPPPQGGGGAPLTAQAQPLPPPPLVGQGAPNGRAPRPSAAATAVKTPVRHALVHGPGIPHAVNDTITAAMGIFTLACLLHIAHVPWQWIAVVAGVCAVCVAIRTHKTRKHAPSTWFALIGGLAVAGWLVWCAATTVYNGMALGVLVLAGCAFGLLYTGVRNGHERIETAQVMARQAARVEAQSEERRGRWETIFHQAGLRDVTINRGYNDHGFKNGEKVTEGSLILRLVLGKEAPDFKGFATYLANVEKIAASHVDYVVRSGSLQPQQPGGLANAAELIIPTKDILDELIPAPRYTGARSICDDLCVGHAVDSTPFGVNVTKNGHAMITGRTEAGKTNVLNAHLYESTRCTDNVNWYIVGPAKAIRGMKAWLKPWLTKMRDPHAPDDVPDEEAQISPVLDWVAPSWEEACLMLLDTYKAVGVRQSLGGIDDTDDQWKITDDSPHISIWIDESPDLLNDERKFKIPAFDGKKYTFSELLVKVLRLARSEAIRVYLLVQRATNSMLGMDAGDIRSQVTYRVGLRANGTIELNSTFNGDTAGIELSTLPDGAFYGERKGDNRPVLVKSFRYEAADIEWAAIHHAQYAATLDHGTAEGLDHYAGRWTRENQQDFFRTLMGGGRGIYANQASASATAVLDPDTESVAEDLLSGIEPDLSDPDIREMYEALLEGGYIDEMPTPENPTGTKPGGGDQGGESVPPSGNGPDGPGTAGSGEQGSGLSDDERAEFERMTELFDTDPLSPEARELVELVRSTDLDFAKGWLFTADLKAAVNAAGMWMDLNENLVEQRISSVMAELGLTKENGGKKRVPDERGRRSMGFSASMLRHAVHKFTA